ncbi:ankyrin repeat domain-containing protein 49 [Condylostylus longicornis]|uniref:ankyrin repeat domain-containing protein 49 n=1 Tax=Condylostylus longicornis TaxID=2530218 RepID=UPI00244E2EF3|nr:ankyrin repeat domain-containing protein 49 [Condylostylus longicornis]
MEDYDSDEDKTQYEKLMESSHKIKPGMFVSGWDDDVVEEEKNPHETLEKEILWAADQNKINVIHEILKLDPECVNSSDDDQYTPLHRACYNNFTDIATLLLKYGADPNARTTMEWTPLHSACKWSNAQSAALLLQHGADVNAKSEGSQTPLHIAATVSNCRNTATVLLMDRNIDANALNVSDETAMDIARRMGLTYPIFEMGHDAYKCETGLID